MVGISGWTHVKMNSDLFLRSICSRYEVHYFSLTMLLVGVAVIQYAMLEPLDNKCRKGEGDGCVDGGVP